MEKQEKAYKGVIEYFKNRIMAGELRPGRSFLRSGRAAQMLEVSRNSAREALRIMDMTGVISSQQDRGITSLVNFRKALRRRWG